MAICDNCKKERSRLSLVDPEEGWVCDKCKFIPKAWSHRDKIKSRVRMPDGAVLEGRKALKIRDERLRKQEREKKYRVE